MSPMRWNNDLHRHFVHAVEQLGGEQRTTAGKILKFMNRGGLTIDHVRSHLQIYRNIKRKEAIQKERQENLIMQMNDWETEQHLRRYERLLKTVECIQTQQKLMQGDNSCRQGEEMHEKTIETGESSNKTEVSCKYLNQSSRIGFNGNDEESKDGNDDEIS